jgi:hypothetical protein
VLKDGCHYVSPGGKKTCNFTAFALNPYGSLAGRKASRAAIAARICRGKFPPACLGGIPADPPQWPGDEKAAIESLPPAGRWATMTLFG